MGWENVGNRAGQRWRVMIGAKEPCKFQIHGSIVRAKRKRVNLTIVPIPALSKESTIGKDIAER
jgi:hypothetical protein